MSKVGLPTHEFKPLTQELLNLVWQWRNSPRIQCNMHNNAPVKWQDHLNWFDSLQGDNTRAFYVLWQNNRPIGVLNFSRLNTPTPEWGCYLGETNVWPGSGIILEVAALDFAANFCHSTHGRQTFSHLLAQVLSFNHAANKMHKIFEYAQVGQKPGGIRDGQEFEVLDYSYELRAWQNKRDKILAKLPKNIGLAAQQIQFLE
ncbi:UDP-4-amino-4,6-dideoxy-N-acetyl-beta-L-altrosamine N-acetyltransferase [Paraglaciecola aquimarina]|uniref:UDP-4-amino-4, 6-dideoxy-N-acetyl-beta-L-altrosamine N-acetyltransferase n=1 Tax=Paraglaciecola algarum TaxID=3050085 RepID=A0ABS9D597_9ALTE|nr:UDP-4-amino-4,6-dideoxy-N-acetyl-beta-L-altrosamine N-acetyltransferase [Paraglaciecola sp. G1-23]MCF2948132.1 UDP-4-amino-4,6-dideoxy-N-acetyl-beta-L-altrosamine N-acetyltransferase [Paraglaciecola sp. G1-23]